MSDHRLLPRYRHDFDEQERDLGRRIRRSGRPAPQAPMNAKAGPSEFDTERLRGIPAIGRNVAGVIRGSDPFWETVNRVDGWAA
jgi:hypothetical protein